jgi:DNA polymerase-3 subunit alpha
MEKEMLGIYISGHPLAKIREQIVKVTNIDTMKMNEIKEELDSTGNTSKYNDGQFVKYAGIISNIKKKYTKNNKLMAFATIEDLYGTAEVIIFENAYTNAANLLVTDNIVLIDGRLSIREDDGVKIVAREIKELSEEENKVKALRINITNLDEVTKGKLRGALKFFSGEKNNTPVQVINGENILDCGTIHLNKEILEEIKELIGYDIVSYE